MRGSRNNTYGPICLLSKGVGFWVKCNCKNIELVFNDVESVDMNVDDW